uniref:Predicted protein n=1 Tax=Hordeum vulgare subsp. vulgare TaxID=112509 RepID=F2DUV6_HORVV|nr:predicted protein [Hordeum vulgare subsp. vulgare]
MPSFRAPKTSSARGSRLELYRVLLAVALMGPVCLSARNEKEERNKGPSVSATGGLGSHANKTRADPQSVRSLACVTPKH